MEKSHFAPLNIGHIISPTFFVCPHDKIETGVEKVYSDVNGSYFLPPFLSLSFCLCHFQLCVQKLRILIEDSDQNCEPSVNACSVSFSHCLRVSGIVHPFRRRTT